MTQYSAGESQFLRARWLTPVGMKLRQEVIDTVTSKADAWPESIKAGAFPGSPVGPHPDFYTDLRGIDLSGLDLRKAEFCFSDVSHGNFKGCTLVDSTFQCCLLNSTDFRGSDLTRADLLQITTLGADFGNAVMAESVLMCAILMACSFEGADLTGSIVDGSHFASCSMQRANLKVRSSYPLKVSCSKRKNDDLAIPIMNPFGVTRPYFGA